MPGLTQRVGECCGAAVATAFLACLDAGVAGTVDGFLVHFAPDSYNPRLLMTTPACPACTLDDVLSHPAHWECATCGHEWPKEEAPEAARMVKDAHGNVLADGDAVTLIKDLKPGGSSVLKAGTKAKNIRLVDGDHEIACKIDGVAMARNVWRRRGTSFTGRLSGRMR